MVLQIRDVVGEVRHVFRPVVHLRTGGVVALEVRARPAAGELDELRPVTGLAERLIRLDVMFAAEALRHAREHQSTLPLHLRLWADTVCADQDALAPLLAALDDSGRDSASEVVARLVVPPGEAAPARLETGLARLHAAGLGVGLDAADTYPQAVLIDAHPEVLILATRHTTALPAAPAALAGAAALADETGAMFIADGVEQRDQAAAMLAHGVHLGQGDLLGPWHRRPTTRPIPVALLDELTSPTATQPSSGHQPAHDAEDTGQQPVSLADLAHPPVAMPHDATGEAVRDVFADRPELTGLVLVDDQQHPGLTLNRDRFMLAVTGPFGHSLYANRPAAQLGDPPRTLSRDATLTEAMALVADSPTHRMYDDIVVVDTHRRCHGVLRIGDLVRDLARRQSTRPTPGEQHPRPH